MRNMIRNLIVAPALLAAAALATTSAMATTLQVPFSFVASGKQCPAGYYNVQKGMNNNVVTLVSRDGSRNFTYVLHPGNAAPTEKRVVLRFEAQGQNHVLESVQYGAQASQVIEKKSRHNEYPQVSIGAGEGR